MKVAATPGPRILSLSTKDRRPRQTCHRTSASRRSPDSNESVANRGNLGDQFGPPAAWPEDILSVIAANPQGSVASLAAMHKESDSCSR